MAMMRSAPAVTAPWITDNPIPPRPKTATLDPASTFAGVQDRADARGDAAAQQADRLSGASLPVFRQGDLRYDRVWVAERRRTHVVVQRPPAV